MKINELIRYVKGQKKASPVCAFDDEMICIWINEIEGMVQSEILLLSPADTIVYSLPDDGEAELLVPAPHSKIYRAYVIAMMEFSGGEYSRYDNTMALFNQWWNEYAAWYAQNIDPASGKGEFKGYYVSAYAIAVKHGYKGSEEEWLSELDLRVKAAEKHADDSAAAAASAMVAVTKYPMIGEDGYWKVWDTVSGEYVSTGIKAEGKPGDPFEYEDFTAEQLEALRGKPGIDGTKWFSGTTDVSGGGYPVYMIAGAVKGDYHLNVITGDICKAGEKYWEFLCNLKGKDGVVGKNGVDGKDGTDGKSAYEYAVEGGYSESEETFYDDLGRVHNDGGGADLSDDLPLMNGTASSGVSKEASRADHVHPTDTTRMPLDFGGMTSFRGDLDSQDRLPVRDTSADETKSCAWGTILSAIKKYVDPLIAEKIEEAITNGIVEASYAVSDSDGINYAFLPEGMTEDGILALQSDIAAALVDYLTREDTESYVQEYAQPKGDYIAADQLDGAVLDALAEAKASGEFDGKNGDDYILTDEDKAEIKDAIAAEVPLVKSAEQPTIVNSVDEMTDTSKHYVLSSDGYFYGYRERANYNLFKISEVSYSSRLQNAPNEGIISSTTSNIVTGWIPVKPGKYYAVSWLYRGTLEEWIGKRVASHYPASEPTSTLIQRINCIKADGTVVVYGQAWLQDVNNIRVNLEHGIALKFADDVVAVQIHMNASFYGTGLDVSTPTKLAEIQCMIVEGDTAQKAYDKSVNSEYIAGDAEAIAEWYNTWLAYNQPADYEDKVIELENDMTELEESVERIEANLDSPKTVSPYYREVNWGCVPNDYFRGRCNSYSDEGFTNYTTYAEYITKFQALVDGHDSYVTKKNLGPASDGQPIYMYDFKPVRWDNELTNIPKIIIVAGQHGSEKCNVFGLYYFVKDLLNNWFGSPALEYLRYHVELMIVPVVNTYGFTNCDPTNTGEYGYKNANGVNINRNYSSGWTSSGDYGDPTSPQYSGSEPFSEPETQIVRDLVLNNSDCVLLIDSHTNSLTNTESWDKLGYYGISNVSDTYFNRARNALAELVSKISPNFNVDYNLDAPNTMFGFLTVGGGNGILRRWGADNDIVTVLIEGFAGFLEGEPVSADVFKANEEQMVNWLITAVNYLAK